MRRAASLRARVTVTPEQYRRVALISLVALVVIVLTGAAVRLTSSGLGCPDWPRCYGKVLPPLSSHALIEFGNRALSGAVGVIVVIAALLAMFRKPFRRDLALLAWLLPLGVLAQAVLGGYTVEEHLAPGFVMAHFALSMLILIAAVALAWRSAHEPGSRPVSHDRSGVWAVRALAPLAGVTVFAGMAATAAGPHSGGAVGQRVHRLLFEGRSTLSWIVHRHATIAAGFGVIAIAVWLLHRHRGTGERVLEPLTVLCVLLAGEGLVGSVQYELHLPADMVWVHVTLATLIWVTTLWAVAAAGRLAPRSLPQLAAEPRPAARGLETAGKTG